MKEFTFTIGQISKKIDMSQSVTRTLLYGLDKWRVPCSIPAKWSWNLGFLIDLKNLCETKGKTNKLYYDKYKKAAKKLTKTIKRMQIKKRSY